MKSDTAGVIVLIVVVFCWVGYMIRYQSICEERGGVLVKGYPLYECVEAR